MKKSIYFISIITFLIAGNESLFCQDLYIENIGGQNWNIKDDAFKVSWEEVPELLGDDQVDPLFITTDKAEIHMVQIQPLSILHQAGFRNGDRIISVNHHPLNGAISVISLLKLLKDEQVPVKVQVIRKEIIYTFVYQFEGQSREDLCSLLINEILYFLNPFSG